MKLFKKETDLKKQTSNSILILAAMAVALFIGASGFAIKAEVVGMCVTSCLGFYFLGASVALAVVRNKLKAS